MCSTFNGLLNKRFYFDASSIAMFCVTSVSIRRQLKKGKECTRLKLGVEWKQDLKLAAVSDADLGRTLAAAGSNDFNLLDDVYALNDTTEHYMLAIQPVKRRA